MAAAGSLERGANDPYHPILNHGLYSVLNVKTSHKYFPRDELLKHLEVREDCHCLTAKAKVNGEEVNIIAIGHKDKKPLLLAGCLLFICVTVFFFNANYVHRIL